jgi:ABC-type uncharacterized transport system substrate-binding protein
MLSGRLGAGMLRRDFLGVLSGAAISLPLGAHAQQAPMPVVGFLNPTSSKLYEFNAAAFRRGFQDVGYVEGENVRIEYRWAEGEYDRLSALAAELVALHVNVIGATGDVASARAAKAATSSIPIVFTIGADPVRGWSCRELQPSRWECHRYQRHHQPNRRQANRNPLSARAAIQGRSAHESR